MPGTLRKPKSKLYKSFLYLNGSEVINSLSALEGGDIDEVLTRSGEEGGGDLSGELGFSGAKARDPWTHVKNAEQTPFCGGERFKARR
jgi:hypothetical protein